MRVFINTHAKSIVEDRPCLFPVRGPISDLQANETCRPGHMPVPMWCLDLAWNANQSFDGTCFGLGVKAMKVGIESVPETLGTISALTMLKHSGCITFCNVFDPHREYLKYACKIAKWR